MATLNVVSYDTHPKEFWQLLKPRVMSLSIFTAFCGMLIAPGNMHWYLKTLSIFCIAMGAGASGCLNMWCEIHRDTLMKRTQNRPLPAGKIDPNSALAFGSVLAIFSVMMLGLASNWFAAFLLAITIISYVFVYTLYLKPRTPQNIVIGGASGALPPVIGWACVTGDTSVTAWMLFLIIFFWTPAHFWALCIDQQEDYASAGFPMYPTIHGTLMTHKNIMRYTLLTIACTIGFGYVTPHTLFYTSGATILGLYFLIQAYRVYYGKTTNRALFFSSIWYLFFIFLVIMIDHFI